MTVGAAVSARNGKRRKIGGVIIFSRKNTVPIPCLGFDTAHTSRLGFSVLSERWSVSFIDRNLTKAKPACDYWTHNIIALFSGTPFFVKATALNRMFKWVRILN